MRGGGVGVLRIRLGREGFPLQGSRLSRLALFCLPFGPFFPVDFGIFKGRQVVVAQTAGR